MARDSQAQLGRREQFNPKKKRVGGGFPNHHWAGVFEAVNLMDPDQCARVPRPGCARKAVFCLCHVRIPPKCDITPAHTLNIPVPRPMFKGRGRGIPQFNFSVFLTKGRKLHIKISKGHPHHLPFPSRISQLASVRPSWCSPCFGAGSTLASSKAMASSDGNLTASGPKLAASCSASDCSSDSDSSSS